MSSLVHDRTDGQTIPRKTTIIQPIFSIEFDHQPLLEFVRCLPHDFRIAILKDVVPPHFNLAITGLRAQRGLRAEVNEFAPEVAFILRDILVERRRKSRIVPSRRLRVCGSEINIPNYSIICGMVDVL